MVVDNIHLESDRQILIWQIIQIHSIGPLECNKWQYDMFNWFELFGVIWSIFFFQFLKFVRKIVGKSLFEKLMKGSFYGQFVAGEDSIRIRPVVERNMSFGVKSILDYSVEKDISTEEARQAEIRYLYLYKFVIFSAWPKNNHLYSLRVGKESNHKNW